jgi:hypothetical protein
MEPATIVDYTEQYSSHSAESFSNEGGEVHAPERRSSGWNAGARRLLVWNPVGRFLAMVKLMGSLDWKQAARQAAVGEEVLSVGMRG